MGKKLVEDFITPDFRESVRAVLDRALQGTETAVSLERCGAQHARQL